MKGVDLPRRQAYGDDARTASLFDEDIQEEELLVEMDLVFQALLEQGLEDHLARAIGRIAGAAHRGLAEVPRMAAEGTLGDPPVGKTAEGQAPVFEFIDHLDRFAAEHFHGVLISEVIRSFHGVEHVPLPMVFARVAQGRADASLGRTRMGPGRVEIGENSHLRGAERFRAAISPAPPAPTMIASYR